MMKTMFKIDKHRIVFRLGRLGGGMFLAQDPNARDRFAEGFIAAYRYPLAFWTYLRIWRLALAWRGNNPEPFCWSWPTWWSVHPRPDEDNEVEVA